MNDTHFGSLTRKRILVFVIIGFTLLTSFKLVKMQLLENFFYQEKSMENSVRKDLIPAPRGVFYDRNNKVLVSNKPSFTLEITPAKFDTSLIPLIETMLHVDKGYIKYLFNENKKYSRHIPIKIKRNVDFDFIAWYQENKEKLRGVEYKVDLQRDYSFGVSGSHLFGYSKEIGAEQYQELKQEYDMGDYIGATGLEKMYESYLRGVKGYRLTLVDAKQKTIGRYLQGEEDKKAQKGDDLILGICAEAQKVAEETFAGKKGALVAIQPQTGEVIALVSAPEYNLADFASVTSSDVWTKLNNDEDKPLFNRATMSIYPPGSTFKMVSATAALNEGIIDEEYSLNCPGGLQFGDRFFKCMHVHGRVNVVQAIEQSCNTFFYSLILKTGLGIWSDYGKRFGFGQKTGIDIPEETSGILPDSAYYNRVYGKNGWTKGFLVSLGIGQGEVSVTPLQLAKYAALLANDGVSYEPHIARAYVDRETQEVVEFPRKEIDLNVDPSVLAIVKEGMYRVVNGDHGTARNIRMEDVEVAGKTGTAQNPHGNDHAIFIGFAPYNNPQIAIALVVENAGYGSTKAAPIAQAVIRAYLNAEKEAKEGKTVAVNTGGGQ